MNDAHGSRGWEEARRGVCSYLRLFKENDWNRDALEK